MERTGVRFQIPSGGTDDCPTLSESEQSTSDRQASPSKAPASSLLPSRIRPKKGDGRSSFKSVSGTLPNLSSSRGRRGGPLAAMAAGRSGRRGAAMGDSTSSVGSRGAVHSNLSSSGLNNTSGTGNDDSHDSDDTGDENGSRTGIGSQPLLTSASLGSSSTARVVTSFRGVPVPEYKGFVPRVGHTAVMYKRNVYLFGGCNAKGQYMGHLYRHEKRSLQWEEVRGAGVVPGGRANHSAILIGEKMYVFGGHKNLDVYDDLFCCNLESFRWDRIANEKSQGPGPCFLHAAVYVPITQSMIVLGGFHQREHNTYIGHAFDMGNKVWSGIPGPAETNPQHLQLVTAAFHNPRNAVIVIGIVDDADAVSRSDDPADMPPPSVHLLNIHSYAWTKVSTASSPESPIPFRLDLVWQEFVREFVMMGGYYDEVQGAWYFPMNLTSLEGAVLGRGAGTARHNRYDTFVDSNASNASVRQSVSGARKAAAKTPQYGFFVLNLTDLNWAIVPTTFQKKLLVELAVKNRERASNRAIQAGAAAVRRSDASSVVNSNSKGGTAYSSALSHIASGLRHVRSSVASADTIGFDSVVNPLQQSSSLGMSRSSLSLGSMQQRPQQSARWAGGGGGAPAGGSTGLAGAKQSALNGLQGGFATAGRLDADRYRKLFLYTVQGAPQFQHKYAFAAYREGTTSGKSKKVKPMKYLIMHGGLTPGEDYAMLMFTPVFMRADVYAVRRAGSLGANFAMEGLEDSMLSRGSDDEEVKAINLLRKLLVDNDNEMVLETSLQHEGRGDTQSEVSAGSRADGKRVQGDPSERDPLARLGNDTASEFFGTTESRDERGTVMSPFASRINGTGGGALSEDGSCEHDDDQEACLLPTLPCTRNEANKNRFAVLYSSANSVRDPHLLPYANCPVAILESEKDIVKWSEQHYLDTRKWLSITLKDAVAEDKQIRRARKRKAKQAQQTHSGTLASRADGLVDSGDDDSDDDSTSGGGGKSSSTIPSSGRAGGASPSSNAADDALTNATEMMASLQREEEQRHAFLKDFFEKHDLDVFHLDQFLAAQSAARAHSIRSAAASSAHGGLGDASLGSCGLATDGSTSVNINTPEAERLQAYTKRHEEQQRLPMAVFRQQETGGAAQANALSDLGSAMAYVLMHNALAVLLADNSPEASSRRARVRWRFLRALVRTGEAAFIIYRATQEASKMQAVKVTSTPGLLLAPELHLIGPTRAYKVPSRPIPYALPREAKQSTRFAELTHSGMVVYHNMRHVK